MIPSIKTPYTKMKAARQLALYFDQEGKYLTEEEYRSAEKPPIRFKNLESLFRRYSIAVDYTKASKYKDVEAINASIEAKIAAAAKKGE